MPIRSLLPVLVLALATACGTVPLTGRSQFLPFSTSEENQLGLETWQSTMADARVVTSGSQAEMVKRVGSRVAAAADRLYPEATDSFAWEFVLIDDAETANAWALPGGKSAVYTGLLPLTQDEAGLAAVMGHEVAHALARHGGERMGHALILQAGLTVAQVASGEMEPEKQQLLLQALAGGGTVLGILPFSRMHESEADYIGVMLAAEAGYDPRAAVALWERMAAQGGNRPLEFLSTHPAESTRIEQLREVMPEALEVWEEAKARNR